MIPAWARDFNNSPRDERSDNPRARGVVEWLRFIRAFGRVSTDNPFYHDEQPGPNDPRYYLLFEVDGHQTSDGRLAYCETYLRQHAEDWGVEPVFRVFLAKAGWARIECYDEALVGECEQALTIVEESYQPVSQ